MSDDYWATRITDTTTPGSPHYVAPTKLEPCTPPPPMTDHLFRGVVRLDLSPQGTVAVSVAACLAFLFAIGDRALAVTLALVALAIGLLVKVVLKRMRF